MSKINDIVDRNSGLSIDDEIYNEAKNKGAHLIVCYIFAFKNLSPFL